MSITRERLADLQAGDVVQATHDLWPEGSFIRGPVTPWNDGQPRDQALYLCGYPIRTADGGAPSDADRWTILEVEPGPRPVYVNADRMTPAAGDVVRDADDEQTATTWVLVDHDTGPKWLESGVGTERDPATLPARLKLLVDGHTGKGVRS